MELGIPYALLGPDGTRIVTGNSDVAKADADYVGWLDPEQGIAGLDSPDVREAVQEIVQGNGGIHFDFFHGRRPIVINAVIDPNVAIGTSNLRDQKIKRATNAMIADALLTFTNTGYPTRRLSLRRQSLRITGRRPKAWQAAMVDADFRLLADVEDSSAQTAIGTAANVTNDGDVLATPRFVLNGPVTSPIVLRNLTTGLNLLLKVGYAIAAGHQLVINTAPPYPTVQLDGAGSAYGQVDFLPSTWWGLLAGVNNLRVDGGAGSTGNWRAYFRDAWI